MNRLRRQDGQLEGELPEPRDLYVYRFEIGADMFAVLEFGVRDPSKHLPDAQLSAAEREVARLVLAGKSNRQIAAVRGTTVRTVANQIASIFRKLKLGSRNELYALCARKR